MFMLTVEPRIFDVSCFKGQGKRTPRPRWSKSNTFTNRAECGLVQYPACKGVFTGSADIYDFYGTTTDLESIAHAVFQRTRRKFGVTAECPPNLPPASTIATTLDDEVVNSAVLVPRNPSIRTVVHQMLRRPTSDYVRIFGGTGIGPEDRDASVVGVSYLTYTLVNSSTYNIDECLEFCDSIRGCVFVNLYYEHNNPSLDDVFPQRSLLKCVAYGDVHLPHAKLDFGDQSIPSGAVNNQVTDTSIQQSTGWARKSYFNLSTPDGYDALPKLEGANDAPGYMTSVFLNHYDVDACATICNNWLPDDVGGSCKYFNIWRAVVGVFPVTYTCSIYYIPAEPSTAVYLGQGNLTVTESRGYKRKTHILDGGFEDYTCNDPAAAFCFTHTTDAWLASSIWEGNYDASIFHYKPYAHTGNSVAILGSAFGSDEYPGTLTVAASLSTEPGVKYIIEVFHSRFGEDREVDGFVEVYWNGHLVGIIYPGYSQWEYDHFEVIGRGNDELDFRGGRAPTYDFIDDISVVRA
ncbi:hypothetical protein F5890DRAFT_1119932 [Lentinula detonsa]|uniref:Fruit-body specific protein a n=1 Tax=Lentinula detonsa TaxID=2804962 RepID=A0AA38Q159_9AGAR|nr:hypothetical protein F5890DRAFT_1119932 [Lentinula detonsa]